MPREVIISQTYRPAPCSAQSRRYAALVMPAIGARTTGTGTVSGPRVRGMPRLSGSPRGGPTPERQERSALLLLLVLPVAAADDLALPGDRVEVLGRPEADRDQLAVLGDEVDQADLRLGTLGELRRQRTARARGEHRLEPRRLVQRLALVEQVKRHSDAREVALAEVAHGRVDEVGRGATGLWLQSPRAERADRHLGQSGHGHADDAGGLLVWLPAHPGGVPDLQVSALRRQRDSVDPAGGRRARSRARGAAVRRGRGRPACLRLG